MNNDIIKEMEQRLAESKEPVGHAVVRYWISELKRIQVVNDISKNPQNWTEVSALYPDAET